MRIVLGILLVVNLLVFYWNSQSTDATDLLASELSTNMPRLFLLSEKPPTEVKTEPADVASLPVVVAPKEEVKPVLPPAVVEPAEEERAMVAIEPEVETVIEAIETPEPPEIVVKTQPQADFIEPRCYTLGPFKEESSLKSVRFDLKAFGIEVKERHQISRELSGYWIYIPPLPNRKEAKKVVSMLKGKGVKDYLIVSAGVKKNAISLGFFSTREGAVQRKTHMQTLGILPVMGESYKESSDFWLDFLSVDALAPPLPKPFIDALRVKYDEILVKKQECLK